MKIVFKSLNDSALEIGSNVFSNLLLYRTMTVDTKHLQPKWRAVAIEMPKNFMSYTLHKIWAAMIWNKDAMTYVTIPTYGQP